MALLEENTQVLTEKKLVLNHMLTNICPKIHYRNQVFAAVDADYVVL